MVVGFFYCFLHTQQYKLALRASKANRTRPWATSSRRPCLSIAVGIGDFKGLCHPQPTASSNLHLLEGSLWHDLTWKSTTLEISTGTRSTEKESKDMRKWLITKHTISFIRAVMFNPMAEIGSPGKRPQHQACQSSRRGAWTTVSDVWSDFCVVLHGVRRWIWRSLWVSSNLRCPMTIWFWLG